jgi:hypothetical protein
MLMHSGPTAVLYQPGLKAWVTMPKKKQRAESPAYL